MPQALKVAPGTHFGRLVVVKELSSEPRFPRGKRRWFKLTCVCGNTVDVTLDRLRSGLTKSCGCLRSELTSKYNSKTKTLHGKRHTVLYTTWQRMIRRLYELAPLRIYNFFHALCGGKTFKEAWCKEMVEPCTVEYLAVDSIVEDQAKPGRWFGDVYRGVMEQATGPAIYHTKTREEVTHWLVVRKQMIHKVADVPILIYPPY